MAQRAEALMDRTKPPDGELNRTAPSSEAPILVRAMSRSGGTLLVTILDAHPTVSMSYELYPELLEWEGGNKNELLALGRKLRGKWSARGARRAMPTEHLGVFLARCLRSGVRHQTFGGLLADHAHRDDSFLDMKGRLRFVASCCRHKMAVEGKSRWGLKCSNRFEAYFELWPDARFLHVLRDGRDVLASQLSTGSFKKSPSEVAYGWVRTHQRFTEFRTVSGVKAYEVRYERLVEDPREETRRIAAFAAIDDEPRMLDYHEKNLTIYKTSHLSMDRISKPVDTARVGRWRRDLTPKQLDEFNSNAGKVLEELGYS